MVSRSDTSKTIRRRTGGAGKKTGKGTTVEQINRSKGTWEMVPGTGTSPYNPPEWRKKKRPEAPVGAGRDFPASKKKKTLSMKKAGPTKPKRTYRDDDATAVVKSAGLDNKAQREELRRISAEQRAKTKAARDLHLGDPQTGTATLGSGLYSKGGTVKKVIGGKIVKKVLSRSKDKGKKGDPGVTYGGGTKKSAVIGQKRVADYTRKRRIEGGVGGAAGGAGLGFVAGTKKKKSKSKKSKTPMHRPVAMAKKGGQLKRKTYGGHHGGEVVASLYDK